MKKFHCLIPVLTAILSKGCLSVQTPEQGPFPNGSLHNLCSDPNVSVQQIDAYLHQADSGFYIDEKLGRLGESPLMVATRCGGAPEVLQFLIENGARVQLRDRIMENTVLHHAIRWRRDAEIISTLARPQLIRQKNHWRLYSSDTANRVSIRLTPLMYALVHSPKAVPVLLAAGADVMEIEPKYGQSTLHYAAAYSTPEVCKLLLEYGADPKVQDANGKYPADYALHRRKHFLDDPVLLELKKDLLFYEPSPSLPTPYLLHPFHHYQAPINAH